MMTHYYSFYTNKFNFIGLINIIIWPHHMVFQENCLSTTATDNTSSYLRQDNRLLTTPFYKKHPNSTKSDVYEYKLTSS